MPATALLLMASLFGCDRGPDPVVVYVSADEQVARPILQAFTEQTGIPVKPLFDTEATKTTGLANRLRRESDRPVADVFWSSEPYAVEQLASEGVLAPAGSDALADHPRAWRHPEDRWFGFSGRARVIVYHPDRLDPDALPASWMDLVNTRYRDKIVMADPRFGTTRGHLGGLKVFWDQRMMPGYYSAWLEGLAENGVRMLPGGNAAVVDAVDRGEALVGLTDTDDVWAAQARGSGVQLIYPRHDLPGERGGGTLVVPNAAGLVAGGANPDGGRALLQYLVSTDVEQALHASNSHNIPLVSDFEIDPRYRVDDPMRLSIPLAAKVMDPAVKEAMERLDPDRIERLRAPGPGRSVPNETGDS